MDIGFHFFRGPRVVLVKNVNTPPPPIPPVDHKRACVQHVNNGSKFRGPCVILVKSVITPRVDLQT